MEKSTGAVSMATPNHRVIIYQSQTGAAAFLEPGILEAFRNDVIEFQNQTRHVAQLVVAQDLLLEDVPAMDPQNINANSAWQFTVDSRAAAGTYEYQVVVTLESGKRVFAIGASTPRIIVRAPSDVD